MAVSESSEGRSDEVVVVAEGEAVVARFERGEERRDSVVRSRSTGNERIAFATSFSNSSCVRLESEVASIVSMKDIAPF